jgi:hypothetical protein
LFISSNAYQNHESVLTETVISEYNTLLGKSEMAIENLPINNLQMEDLSVDYTQENKFFKGFLLALPIATLLWGITILGIKSLFF